MGEDVLQIDGIDVKVASFLIDSLLLAGTLYTPTCNTGDNNDSFDYE